MIQSEIITWRSFNLCKTSVRSAEPVLYGAAVQILQQSSGDIIIRISFISIYTHFALNVIAKISNLAKFVIIYHRVFKILRDTRIEGDKECAVLERRSSTEHWVLLWLQHPTRETIDSHFIFLLFCLSTGCLQKSISGSIWDFKWPHMPGEILSSVQ